MDDIKDPEPLVYQTDGVFCEELEVCPLSEQVDVCLRQQ